MEVRKLKPAEWPQLTPIFDKVFDSEMPNPEHAEIVGCFDGERLEGFIVLERPVFIWEFYSRDEKNRGGVVRKMLKYVRDSIPGKQAVGAGADEPRIQMLFKTLGMDEMPGKLFWRSSK